MVNVSRAVKRWRNQKITVKQVEKTTVDFVEVDYVKGWFVWCMVQPTKHTSINNNTLDWTKKHITLYSVELIDKGLFIQYKGRDYKVVDSLDWVEYGYSEAICEEIKSNNLIEVDEYV